MKKRTFSKIVLLLTFLLITNYMNCFSINYHNIDNATYEKSTLKKDLINPVDKFEQVWQEMNEMYPHFDQHGLDWDSFYKVYKPKISPTTTYEEFRSIN